MTESFLIILKVNVFNTQLKKEKQKESEKIKSLYKKVFNLKSVRKK